MTARISHELVADGVLIAFIGEDGRRHIARVTIAEAKRFGWALLADVDPDEVGELDPEPAYEPPVSRPPTQLAALARTLCHVARTTAQMAKLTHIEPGVISARMAALIDRGFVSRIDGGGGRGTRAIYALTMAGHQRFGSGQ